MIVLSPECFPCFLRQADLAARAHGADEARRTVLAARVSRMLADLSPGEIPARIATRLQTIAREVLGTGDPFLRVKQRELRRFRETASRAETLVAASADPLSAAVRLSVFGNIMDSGIVEPESMESAIACLPAANGAWEMPPRLRERIARAARIGVLLDNAGEVAFDVPLLSRLSREGKSLWIGVKGGPVIDDLTEAEARGIGLAAFGELVSNGNQGVGTDLDLCPDEFRSRIASSDLVISKGQANFETLVGRVRHAYFLLRCKCPVVSRALGREEGEMIVLDGGAAA
ncbi:MAG: damage-control phosphatase ARMT1 family protein [Deltaproteobacteria bacterium]